MIPYRDENQTQRVPIVTLAIIAINVAVWLLFERGGQDLAVASSVCNYGHIPGQLTGLLRAGTHPFPMGDNLVCMSDPGRGVAHLITSMFLHGSWMHLIGNMWFFWLFGNNIEDSMTRPRFIAFYPHLRPGRGVRSDLYRPRLERAHGGRLRRHHQRDYVEPTSSLYPRVRVHTLVFLGFFITTIALPAWAMLLYWVALPVFGAAWSRWVALRPAGLPYGPTSAGSWPGLC